MSSIFRAALIAWTQLHAVHCAAHNVGVNTLLPGYLDSYPADAATVAAIPPGRIGRVEEIGEVVAFLLSGASSCVTGQGLTVDGGGVRML